MWRAPNSSFWPKSDRQDSHCGFAGELTGNHDFYMYNTILCFVINGRRCSRYSFRQRQVVFLRRCGGGDRFPIAPMAH